MTGTASRFLRNRNFLVLPGLFLTVIFFLVPVLFILQTAFFDPAFTLQHFERFFTRGAYGIVFQRTLEVSATVALICLLIGYPTAYYIAAQPKHRQPLLLFLVLVPLWMSILIRTYAWMVILGREGIINSTLAALGLIDAPLKLLFTTGAVHLGMVQILLPIMVLTCFSAMTQIDRGLVRAARVFGAGPFRAFWQVFFPLSLQGAVNGTVVVFILSIGFFITPALIGGRRDAMIANLIASQVERGNWGFAGAMSLLLLAASLAVLAVIALASGRFVYRSTDPGERP